MYIYMYVCSLLEVDKHFTGAYCLHFEGDHPGDGGSMNL
jgi:hypothetical protein